MLKLKESGTRKTKRSLTPPLASIPSTLPSISIVNCAMHNANAQQLKEQARNLGFSFCGISKATELTDDARRLENWLNANRNGQMRYMENYFDIRIDPRKLVDNAKSVITLLFNYFPEKMQRTDTYQVSKYAYGNDYHEVIKHKLHELLQFLRNEIGDINGRCFVDSAPILERSWAQKSGAGWVGKNGNLITKQHGSFFFLAEIVCDVAFEYDTPFSKDYCGTCKACVDACPTQAIMPNKEIDGSKCISYFTIELKDAIPQNMKGQFQDWIFGCDACQDVCPWNRFSSPNIEPKFKPNEELLNYSKVEWEEITAEVFQKVFRKSAINRTKYDGLMRNIKFIAS